MRLYPQAANRDTVFYCSTLERAARRGDRIGGGHDRLCNGGIQAVTGPRRLPSTNLSMECGCRRCGVPSARRRGRGRRSSSRVATEIRSRRPLRAENAREGERARKKRPHDQWPRSGVGKADISQLWTASALEAQARRPFFLSSTFWRKSNPSQRTAETAARVRAAHLFLTCGLLHALERIDLQ